MEIFLTWLKEWYETNQQISEPFHAPHGGHDSPQQFRHTIRNSFISFQTTYEYRKLIYDKAFRLFILRNLFRPVKRGFNLRDWTPNNEPIKCDQTFLYPI